MICFGVFWHMIRIFSLCLGENDPYENINQNSTVMIQDILEQGMAEGVFRKIDPSRISILSS